MNDIMTSYGEDGVFLNEYALMILGNNEVT